MPLEGKRFLAFQITKNPDFLGAFGKCKFGNELKEDRIQGYISKKSYVYQNQGIWLK
jgi:hypothetical protein